MKLADGFYTKWFIAHLLVKFVNRLLSNGCKEIDKISIWIAKQKRFVSPVHQGWFLNDVRFKKIAKSFEVFVHVLASELYYCGPILCSICNFIATKKL